MEEINKMTKPNRGIYRILRSLRTAGLLLILTPHGQALAQSCKGLSQSRCGTSQDCTWVKGYVTKKGNTVKSYCRAKGGNGKQQASSRDKASEKSKQGSDSKRSTSSKKDTKTEKKSKKDKKSSSKDKKESSSKDKK